MLGVAQERGLLGPEAVSRQIEHTLALAAIVEEEARIPASFVDVGTGGGLPGLVFAHRWAECRALLVDARRRSFDFLEFAVASLGLGTRVAVALGRAEELAASEKLRESFDLAVCRAVGPPPVSAELAALFVKPGGWVVVSEPPGGAQWNRAGLERLGLDSGRSVAIRGATARLLPKTTPAGAEFPRRTGLASKRPLWPTSPRPPVDQASAPIGQSGEPALGTASIPRSPRSSGVECARSTWNTSRDPARSSDVPRETSSGHVQWELEVVYMGAASGTPRGRFRLFRRPPENALEIPLVQNDLEVPVPTETPSPATPTAVSDEDVSVAARTPTEDEAEVTIEPATVESDAPVVEPEPLMLPIVVAVANQKGGVGKTTTAVNLGAALADLGFRVLVVDLDPQGNATTGLGVNARGVSASTYDVLMTDARIEDCVEPTSVRNLFVCPATIDLAGAEIELVPAMSRELKLRKAVDAVKPDYDFVFVDCPPSLGLLTVNGLAAADGVLVPVQCEYYALEGLGQLLRNVSLVRQNLNPPLDVIGIVLTMYDARTKLAEQVAREVREHFGGRVYKTVVPRTVRISEAPSFGQPVTVFDATSRGSRAYRSLAEEVSRGATRRAG